MKISKEDFETVAKFLHLMWYLDQGEEG